MLLLHLVSFFVSLLGIGFLTLCLASGLLYLAEIIEENSQPAKRFGKQLIQVIIFAHLAFYLSDGLPLSLTLLGILCHLVYLSNFSRSWPIISLTSFSFIASCALVIIDHFAWFFYFADRASKAYHQPLKRTWQHALPKQYIQPVDQLTFLDISTFFALCVWMVPFFLFLSLSAGDNVLPNSHDAPSAVGASVPSPARDGPDLVYYPSEIHKVIPSVQLSSPRKSMLKGMLQSCISSIPRVGVAGPGGRTSSRPNEGLIAGSSPTCTSTPSSPAFSSGPRSPMVLISSSPPTSPGSISANARRLSPIGPGLGTTSPRRTFSSGYSKPLVRSPSPPASPVNISASARRLSPCGPIAATTAPRRAFSSQAHNLTTYSPSPSLPTPQSRPNLQRSDSGTLSELSYSSASMIAAPEVKYVHSPALGKAFSAQSSRPGSPLLLH